MQHDPGQGTSDTTHWSHEPEIFPDEDANQQEAEEEPEHRRYGLRPRTVKRQYVYSTTNLKAKDYEYNHRKETVNNFRMGTVNKTGQRHFNVHALKTLKVPIHNRETEFTECSVKDTFMARKRAWRLHFSLCETKPCKECEAWTRVRHAKWSPNEREYAECLIELDKINVEKRQPTKIKFSEEPVKVKIVKRYLKVDAYALSLATKFCTSLKEILGMSQHIPGDTHGPVPTDRTEDNL